MNQLIDEPNIQDLVKSKITNVTGIVIAKYPKSETVIKNRKECYLLDIRLETGAGDRNIRYDSPAELWEVVKRYDPMDE